MVLGEAHTRHWREPTTGVYGLENEAAYFTSASEGSMQSAIRLCLLGTMRLTGVWLSQGGGRDDESERSQRVEMCMSCVVSACCVGAMSSAARWVPASIDTRQ